jgi:hypothetical protein
MQKTILILFIPLAIAGLCWSVYRDIQIEKQYPGDLRNRIVGSRLQKDGHLPYFYKWKNTDGIRYYDPQNFDSLKVSNITATPFFHMLLFPIIDLPQRTISRLWLLAEYLLLLIMAAVGFSLAKNKNQKWVVVSTSLLFLFTNAWTGHIAAGQMYLVIPFFMLLFYYFVSKRSNSFYAALAGICTAILILVRPNTMVFFLPFIFIAHLYTRKYKLVFITSVFAIFLLAFTGSKERMYWKEYGSALSEQVKSHQGLHPAFQQNEADPHPITWEEWDTNQIAKHASQFHYSYNREHGNVFILINHSLNIKIPVWALLILSLACMLFISFLFYKRSRAIAQFNLYSKTILAFCLYMVSDIFSPIHRFQYNASQWIFPLLLIAAQFNFANKKIYAGFILGLVLNSLNLPFMPMEQTIGEYIIFLSTLVLLFTYKPEVAE